MLTSWHVKEELIMMKGEWAVHTCAGCGLPSLVWLFSPHRVLVTVIPEEMMAFIHSFVTTWLHGSLRRQVERRTDESKVIRLGKTVRFRTPPLSRIFPLPTPLFPPQQRA